MLIQTDCNSPIILHFFKVKSHAALANYEWADAAATCQATLL